MGTQALGGALRADTLARINALAANAVYTGADGLTAHVGGGQTSALLLAATFNRVSTVGTIGDSVKLPVSAGGGLCTITNDSAVSMQVFGSGTDTINDVATATGVAQAGKTTVTYYCPVAGKWYSSAPSSAASFLGLQTITADGAVAPHVGATYVITKAGVAAMTLAAPTTTTDDGLRIRFVSNTTNAHTLTATGLLGTGTVKTDVGTFAAFLGAGLEVMAYQGKWLVLSSVGIVFT